MSHEIDFSLGRPAFVFDQTEGHAWHGLGQPIPAEAAKDPRKIAELAGADYRVSKYPVRYVFNGKAQEVPNRMALVREDTGECLEVLSDNKYKEVQPVEYFEAFRDTLAKNQLRISAAGVLKGGRILFVNAVLDREFSINVMGNDPSVSYLCLGGGYDGKLSSFGYLSTFRTVCWNTLSANLAQSKSGGKLFRVAHSAAFDAKILGSALGMLGQELKVEARVFNGLAGYKVQREQVAKFLREVAGIGPEVKSLEEVSPQQRSKYTALYETFLRGPGADLPSAAGTAYGLLNAVTHYVDHKAPTRDTAKDGVGAARFASAQFGTGATMKRDALDKLMAMAGIGENVLVAA